MNADTLAHRQKELAHVEAALREAGEAIERIAQQGFEVEDKLAGSGAAPDPVTSADYESNRIVEERLRAAFPDDGWLSEESDDDATRWGSQRVWVVDPLDGTREFVKRRPEYAVSVGLLEAGEPVLGGIYNCAVGELFLGFVGGGVTLNGAPVSVRAEAASALEVIVSRSEMRRGQFADVAAHAQLREVGSIAYKLAKIAAGCADACISLAPKSEWDIVGGVALIRAAGGEVVGLDGESLRFNQDPPLVSGLVASSRAALESAVTLVGYGTRVTGR